MNTGSRFDSVVFDLFRTLISPEAFNPTAYKRIERMAQSLDLDPVDFERWWGRTKSERNCSRYPSIAERIKDYCEKAGRPKEIGSIEKALDFAQQYHDQAVLNPQPEVLQTLNSLHDKGMKLAILSNTDEREIRYLP